MDQKKTPELVNTLTVLAGFNLRKGKQLLWCSCKLVKTRFCLKRVGQSGTLAITSYVRDMSLVVNGKLAAFIFGPQFCKCVLRYHKHNLRKWVAPLNALGTWVESSATWWCGWDGFHENAALEELKLFVKLGQILFYFGQILFYQKISILLFFYTSVFYVFKNFYTSVFYATVLNLNSSIFLTFC